MPENSSFILVAIFVLGFGLFSARLARGYITPAMAFTAFGLLLSPFALGLGAWSYEHPAVHLLAEMTLVLVLFGDAARIDLTALRHAYRLPVRLLALGMPLTIALGALTAAFMFDALSIWEALILGVILAPTDAALGQAVVINMRIPVRIRQTINVESGLNDGIAVPILVFVMTCADMSMREQPTAHWILFAARQVVLGPIVGVAVGYIGGKLIVWADRSGNMNHAFRQLATLSLAILAFGLAEWAWIGGNGFIAAFCAGMVVGNTARPSCECLYDFLEVEGQLLTLLAFLLFGWLMIWPASELWDIWTFVYAALSLTALRMVPVAISLLGSGLKPVSTVFIGWFGPRGLASIVFALVLVESFGIAGREQIFSVCVATVLLSVVAHGVTAYPLSEAYARYIERFKQRGDSEEHVKVPEHPTRVPMTEM